MAFKKDLATGQVAENKVMNLVKRMKNYTDPKFVGETLPKKELMLLQRRYGDIEVQTADGPLYIEVKSYSGMERFRNIFWETLSDNGSWTNQITPGWGSYSDEECDIDVYIFYNREKPSHSISVRRYDIRNMIEKFGDQYRLAEMKSNKTQKNRSEGLLVPIADILYHCKTHTIVNLSQ